MQGFFLPAFTRKPKRKTIHAPKFYFANVGVVNFLAKRRELEPGSESFGKAFENFIINEIRACNSYHKHGYEMHYWRLVSGTEVDLVIDELDLAVEIKSSQHISAKHLKGIRELAKEHPKFKKKILVSLEKTSRVTDDNILIYAAEDFLAKLWAGEILH